MASSITCQSYEALEFTQQAISICFRYANDLETRKFGVRLLEREDVKRVLLKSCFKDQDERYLCIVL